MANAINMIFYKFYQNPLGKLLKQFDTLSALGACRVIIIREVVYTKSIIQVFSKIFQVVFIFFQKILFGSKILPSTCDKDQNIDYGCSSYPGDKAESPEFDRFATILCIFRAD